MACNSAYYSTLFFYSKTFTRPSFRPIFSSVTQGTPHHNNAFISEAVRILGPPAKFEASKLTVDFMGQEVDKCSRVVPRIYILSHCDFTADLTLTISNIINVDQLQGWYIKDDVVAEWKEMNGRMCLVVHCYVSGPNNLFRDLVSELRYHIFSKELPLVLQAVLYGDSVLFREYPELMDSVVWVYFHSSSAKFNCIECWGPFKDAAQRGTKTQSLLPANHQGSMQQKKLQSPKSFFTSFIYFSSLSWFCTANHTIETCQLFITFQEDFRHCICHCYREESESISFCCKDVET